MSERPGPDPHDLPELRRLAATAERLSDPPPPAHVRGIATRRRRRRVALAAVAAVAVVAGVGGGVLLQRPPGDDQATPPVAGSRTAVPPSAVPTPDRTLGPTPDPTSAPSSASGRTLERGDLIRPEDVPWPGSAMSEVTTAVGLGRPQSAPWACVPDQGLEGLGAVESISRSFVYRLDPADADPEHDALVYAAVLRFDDAAAAQAAERKVRGWRGDCSARLASAGRTELSADPTADPDGAGERTVRSGGREVGTYTQVSWRPADATEARFDDSVGVVRDGARLAVVLTRTYGTDDGDAHPQVGLLRAADQLLDG